MGAAMSPSEENDTELVAMVYNISLLFLVDEFLL